MQLRLWVRRLGLLFFQHQNAPSLELYYLTFRLFEQLSLLFLNHDEGPVLHDIRRKSLIS